MYAAIHVFLWQCNTSLEILTELERKPHPESFCCSREGAKRHFFVVGLAALQSAWSPVGETH